MRHTILLFTFLLCCITFLSLAAQSSKKQDRTLLRQARNASNVAFTKHDLADIAAHFIRDVTVTSGNGTVIISSDSVIAVLKSRFEAMPDIVYIRTPKAFKISKKEAMAWEEGTWIARRTQAKDFQETGGKYAAMWQKVNGIWKIRSELFVTLY